jgi:two-component system, NarL family, nitrate/nitrite response regulator NarL
MIALYILADICLYREGLAQLLAHRFEVVGTAATWRKAAGDIAELQPSIVLVDMVTPQSIDAVRSIVARHADVKVLALTVPDVEEDVIACVEAGISGFVTREDSIDALTGAIESVARGEVLCSPRMAGALLRRVTVLAAAVAPPRAGCARLTRREREIVDLIGDGLSNKAIAQQLCIQPATVKNHVHNILEKLQVGRRTDAVAHVRGTARPRGS